MNKKVDYSDKEQRNPQNDPDVESGWKRAQEKLKEKQEEEDAKRKGVIKEHFEVDTGGIDDSYQPYKK